jgi:hypothetical protein
MLRPHPFKDLCNRPFSLILRRLGIPVDTLPPLLGLEVSLLRVRVGGEGGERLHSGDQDSDQAQVGLNRPHTQT